MLEPLILVVEDDPAQREVLHYNIQAEGYRLATAESGDRALDAVKDELPDLILLDWMLPNISGIEVCRQLKIARETRDIPIIMLSAKSEETDRVRGLEIGADDYVVKPYSVGELLARIRNQLRRVRPSSVNSVLEFDGIVMNIEEHRVHRGTSEIKLGPTEYRLLATFLERPGRVWSREQLLNRVWGLDAHLDTRTVDVHVGRLRKALSVTGEEDLIRTVRSAGYSLG